MKIVRFKNGAYGVRRLSPFGFQFLSSNGYWRSKSYAFEYTLEHTKEDAEALYMMVADKGTPV